MASDPAFLFYPGDYLKDTQCLSEPVQVAYDRIMCEHMRNICISKQQLNFFTKRLTSEQKEELMHVLSEVRGGYQITWVAESIEKRRKYSDSRRKNRSSRKKDMSNTSSTYVPHMENAIENENAIDIVNRLIKESFDEIYIEQQKMQWKNIDFDFELEAFGNKVIGSPEKYQHHDTGGMRLASQAQLRNAKRIPANGRQISDEKMKKFDAL